MANFEQSFVNLANNALQITLQALNEKDQVIKAWKGKAERLAAKHKACLDCGEREGWEPETLRCFSCHRRLKEVAHA